MIRRVCPVGRCRAATPGLSVTVPPYVAKCGARQPFRPALLGPWGGGGLGIASPLCEGRRFMGLRTAPLMAAAAGTNGPSADGDGPQSDASLLGPFSPGTPLFFARLYLAARDGDIAAVNALIANVAPTGDEKRWHERTDTNNAGALGVAVQYGRLEVVKALLAAGADPNTTGRCGVSPLLAAVRGQRTPIVEALIAAGADVNAIYHNDDDGLSTMSAAVGTRNADVVKALLAAKADPNGGFSDTSCSLRSNCRDNMRREPSPLVKAIQHGSFDIVEALLAAGADPNLRGTDCCRPLFEAVRNSDCSIAIIKALLAAGANVNAVTRYCETALSMAARTGNVDVFEALIAAKADVNECAPIVAAAFNGHAEIVQRLLSLGADIDSCGACTTDGSRDSSDYCRYSTPLIAAIAQQHDAIVEMLLATKADPNGGAERYYHTLMYDSPLPAAVGVGRSDYVTALLKAGADANVWFGDVGPLIVAASARMGDLPIVRALIAAGADVNVRVEGHSELEGSTALMVTENPEIAQALIDAGADVNAYHGYGYTVLAGAYKRPELAKVLIAAGADVNADTPIVGAARAGDLSSVQFLLASGADVNVHDRYNGSTALHEAGKYGHEPVIKALIAAGADVNAKDFEGKTPAQVAAQWGQSAAVEILPEAASAAVEALVPVSVTNTGTCEKPPTKGVQRPPRV